jgi:hypothetical protein
MIWLQFLMIIGIQRNSIHTGITDLNITSAHECTSTVMFVVNFHSNKNIIFKAVQCIYSYHS